MKNSLVFPEDDGGRRPVEFVSYEQATRRVTLRFDLDALLKVSACALIGLAFVKALDG